jgi:diguanylate cyclase (GGDEF)-like protein
MEKIADLKKRQRVTFWTSWVKQNLNNPGKIAERITEKEAFADYDTLTKVLNRRGLENYLKLVTPILKRNNQRMAIAFVDINGLKKVNDSKGHAAGDKIILHVAESLKKSIRSSDFVGRWGGDEFVVVLTGSMEKNATLKIVERINHFLGKKVSVAIGIEYWKNDEDPASLIDRTDRAMYQAKKSKSKTPHILVK